ncbi:MAG: M28 family peptidase [Patulibacter minatonensis]
MPGANDNLSGVAVLVGLAERLRDAPIDGVRIMLVSAGAEEELQGGIYGFLEAHAAQLDPATTRIFAVDTVGSPQLVMLEGEGPVRMHDYEASFRDLVAEVAEEAGVNMERGLRSRFSTDGVVPRQLGIPTVSLVSLAPWRAPSNYHLMTDTPENVVYESVQATVDLSEAIARRLGRDARRSSQAATAPGAAQLPGSGSPGGVSR